MSDTTGTQGADPSDIEMLASAYLDGEVTADERAQVESNNVLLAEVERLRQVRAVLGATTEPPAISVRESHLAAALDVWDRMPETERSGEVAPSAGMNAAAAAAISTPAPTSLAARRDRRSSGGSTKWLMGAAAGLAVIAGAGIVLQGLGADDDDSAADSFEAEAPAEEPASEAEIVAEMAVDEFSGEEAESALPDVDANDVESEDGRFEAEPANEPAEQEPAEEAPAEEPEEQEAMEEAAMEEEVMEEAAPAAEASDDAEDPSSPEIDLFELLTPEDLADFAAIAFYAPVDAEAPPDDDIEPTFNTCEVEFAGTFTFDLYAGPALYQEQLVVVAVDSTTDPANVIAFTEICEFVASVPLPPEDEFNQRVATETVLDQP